MTSTEQTLRRAKATARRQAARGKRYSRWFMSTPVGRALERFLDYNGNVLAGGIAYYSLASIAAAVVLLASVASYVVVGNEEYRQDVIDFVSEAVPGIFSTDGQTGLVDPETIQPTSFTGVLGIITFGVLVYTATRYLRGLRAGVRSMLGDAAGESIPGTLRDVIALIGLAVIAVLATGMQIVGGALAAWFAGLFGDGGGSAALVRVAAVVAGLIANGLFAALVFLLVGQAKVRFSVLLPTVGVTALAFTVMQQASGYFVSSASSNAVLAPFAAIIALLIFVDFTARILLVASAWLGAAAGGLVDASHRDLASPARRRRGTVSTRRAVGLATSGDDAQRRVTGPRHPAQVVSVTRRFRASRPMR